MGDQHGSFEERLRAARAQQGLDKPPATGPAGGEVGTSAMGLALRVGIELVASLAVGLAIGWALDRWLGTTPWLLGLFVVLGGAAGVVNLWRLLAPRKSGGMGSE